MNNLKAVFSLRFDRMVFAILLLCSAGASAQQVQPSGKTSVADLPNLPQPQQLAQATIPGLPASLAAGSAGLTWDQMKA